MPHQPREENMEFCEENYEKVKGIVSGLCCEGICWHLGANMELTYTGAYEHASGEVSCLSEEFMILGEACDPSESGLVVRKSFRGRDLGTVLRDVAECVGRIDQGIEDGIAAVSGYESM